MANPNFDVTLEGIEPMVQQQGLNSNKAVHFTGTETHDGAITNNGTVTNAVLPIQNFTSVAVNATATLSTAAVLSGYITSTSGSATTMKFPTGANLGAALGAVRGTMFDLFVDNTAGASTVTMQVNTGAILSDAANTTSGSFGQLTVASGTTGIGRFTLVFATTTSYVITRTA